MKINKIFYKIIDRYKKFKDYPLTKNEPFLALFRYFKFNIITYFDNKKRVYNWVNELKFYAKKGEAGIVPNIYFKLFDYEDSMFLLDHLQEDDLFVDVGANVGHFSLLAASKKAKVIAIEPIPDTFRRLNDNVVLNNFENLINLMNIGIADKKGKLFFTTTSDVMNKVSLTKTANTIEVEVTTLDDLLINLSPKLIKIDVEGYEKFVLQGATKIISSPSLFYLIIELNNSSENFNTNNDEIHNSIMQCGFLPAKYNVEDKKIVKQLDYNKDSFNTLYVKKELIS
ncbi:FkbM family methyltransferase [Flavobacterium sp. ZB4P13]|uniref:FkbM family methyltransferase n=1 Tax=Flavobacterium sp. ZB4P13 TaxID=3401728 RepID=UPI003AAB2B9E